MTNINAFQGDVFIHEYIKHTEDDNNLFGFSGDDTFKIATAGSDRLTVSSSGVVDISGTLSATGTATGIGLVNLIYPVGSIYISIVSTNPGTYYTGTTWVAFGAGRTLVGLNPSDGDFNSPQETGGSKTHTLTIGQMPSHNHSYQDRVRSLPGRAAAGSGRYEPSGTNNDEFSRTTGSRGSTQAHNNLQPYIVVYMWKRTV
jgi:hypothetical protein